MSRGVMGTSLCRDPPPSWGGSVLASVLGHIITQTESGML